MSFAIQSLEGFDVTVDTRTAAEMLHVSEQALRKSRSRGAGPKCLRQGRRIRYRITDLAAYEDARKTITTRTGASNEEKITG